jgi:hypothetical protein
MSGVLIAVFLIMLYMAQQWPLRASVSVYFIAGLGLLITAIQILRDCRTLVRIKAGATAQPAYTWDENRPEIVAWLWLVGLLAACWLFGFHIAFVAFPLAYGYVNGASLKTSALVSVGGLAMLWIIYDYFQGAIWPEPLLLPFIY